MGQAGESGVAQRAARADKAHRRHLARTLAGVCLPLAWSAPALAQSAGATVAPSRVTPPSLRPAPAATGFDVAIPAGAPLTPPPGAEGLSVTAGPVTVEGALPAVAAAVARLTKPLASQPLTLARLYAVAGEVEQLHARAGYVLARVSVPPQTLADGAPVRLVVTDGHVESVDTSALPERVRGAVAARVAPLVGTGAVTLTEIEQSLLLAGQVPGLKLTSTLARGTEPGGTRLVLAGSQRLVTGSLSFDNALPGSLDRYGGYVQLALNSALGLGEQIYGFAGGGYDLGRLFAQDARVRVLGGGVAFGLAGGRLTLNPEATFSRTQAKPQAGVPLSRGVLRRLTLRGSYVLAAARSGDLRLDAAIEQVNETNDLIGFGVRLSHDRFMTARAGLGWSRLLPGGGFAGVDVQLSQGLGKLGGLALKDLPAGQGYSRAGSTHAFTKASFAARLRGPLGGGVIGAATLRGQTAFGAGLPRSEQVVLEGPEAVSAWVGGATSLDSGASLRGELQRPLALPAGQGFALQAAPYLFVAAGAGSLAHPTELEQRSLRVGAVGAGLRLSLPQWGATLSGEYARGFANVAALNRVNRLNLALAVRF